MLQIVPCWASVIKIQTGTYIFCLKKKTTTRKCVTSRSLFYFLTYYKTNHLTMASFRNYNSLNLDFGASNLCWPEKKSFVFLCLWYWTKVQENQAVKGYRRVIHNLKWLRNLPYAMLNPSLHELLYLALVSIIEYIPKTNIWSILLEHAVHFLYIIIYVKQSNVATLCFERMEYLNLFELKH